ncbi:MAG: hypothetical protein A4E57_04066 [Syntrophorhabdaceae bacterium PtaU1.Bin034]|nr:MAG: hypothetical protein A4E57_04066 [Syntrophorhabdaceae bacterium PtaU1.Bin034]
MKERVLGRWLLAVLSVVLGGVLIVTVAGCGGGGGGGSAQQPAPQDSQAALNVQNAGTDYYNQLSSQSDPSALRKTITF